MRKTASRALYHSIVTNCRIPAYIFLSFVILYLNTTHPILFMIYDRDVPSLTLAQFCFANYS